jgi:hypothetical protein
MWVVKFTPRPLQLRGKRRGYPFSRGMGGPQSLSGRLEGDKITFCCRRDSQRPLYPESQSSAFQSGTVVPSTSELHVTNLLKDPTDSSCYLDCNASRSKWRQSSWRARNLICGTPRQYGISSGGGYFVGYGRIFEPTRFILSSRLVSLCLRSLTGRGCICWYISELWVVCAWIV